VFGEGAEKELMARGGGGGNPRWVLGRGM